MSTSGNPLGRLETGTTARLVYASDFTSAALGVRLLEVDEDLLQEILHTGVTIKGGDTEPAVLCTQSRTFALQELPFSSNSLVLVPPGGVVDNAPADALADEGDDAAAVTVTACCPASGHLEVLEVAPPLSALRALLRTRPYTDACEGAADGSAAIQGVGFSWEELCDAVHCSSAQLRAGLAQHGALCIHGKWMVLDPGYMRRVLDLVVMNAGINGWPLSALPLEETVTALSGDGVDIGVARHVIMIFSSTPPPADGDATMSQAEVALDARRVCTEKAAALLEKQPMWRLDEFMIAWTSTCPEGMPPQQDMLRGLALLDPQGADFTVSAFLASELAPKPKDRFAMLFTRKERWTRAELEPYLQHVEEAGASIDALLLTWCRRSQGSASEPEIYTQRHAA